MPIITAYLPDFVGVTGLSLVLRKRSDRSIVNIDGDSLSPTASTVDFEADVAEVHAELCDVEISDAAGIVAVGEIAVGETVVRPPGYHDAIHPGVKYTYENTGTGTNQGETEDVTITRT